MTLNKLAQILINDFAAKRQPPTDPAVLAQLPARLREVQADIEQDLIKRLSDLLIERRDAIEPHGDYNRGRRMGFEDAARWVRGFGADIPTVDTVGESAEDGDGRKALYDYVSRILDDRWPLTGKIMAEFDRALAASRADNERLRSMLPKSYDERFHNATGLATIHDWVDPRTEQA